MNDLELARASRDAYALPMPLVGAVIDWEDMRVVTCGGTFAVRGTDSYANAKRDMEIADVTAVTHPQLGPCPSGPLNAAINLFNLIVKPRPSGVVYVPTIITGHSLGGQCALLIAGLLISEGYTLDRVVTWDAPKAGGPILQKLLEGVPVHQYKFRGSVVTDWPLFSGLQMRTPLIEVCEFDINVVQAHSIERACTWLAANHGFWS